jgi:signal transduction histidine kinase
LGSRGSGATDTDQKLTTVDQFNSFATSFELLSAFRHEAIGRIDSAQMGLALVLSQVNDVRLRAAISQVSADLEQLSKGFRAVRLVNPYAAGVEPRSCQLGAVLSEVLDMFALRFDSSRIHVQVTSDSSTDDIGVAASVVRTVLINLIMNSVQALSAKRQGTQREIKVVVKREPPGDRLSVLVSDNGPGTRLDQVMAKAKELDSTPEALLMSQGFTTKSEGSGLGLSVSRSQLRAFGGDLRILEYHNGFAVRVRFPNPMPPVRKS